MVEAVLAALLGAFCYGLAATLQHHEAARAPASPAVHPRILWQLARRPVWLLGITAAATGAALHLFALSRGPLTLVQPIGVTGLLFVIPLAAAIRRHRIRLQELVAAAVILAGLGALLAMLPTGAGVAMTDGGTIAGLVLGASILAAGSVAVATVATGRVRSLVLALGAGVAFGCTSALARVLLQLDGHSHVLLAVVLAGGGIAVLAPLGLLLLQSAYRTGGAVVVLATLTVADPLVAAASGVLLLAEPLPQAPTHVAVLAAGALCATLGVVTLARSPAQHGAALSRDGSSRGTAAARDAHCVLIGADTYPPDVNGAASFTHRLASGLAARGHEVHVLCPSTDGPASASVDAGVVVHRLRSVRTPFHASFRVCLPPWVGPAVREVLDAVGPDVVHVQGHFMIGRSLIRDAGKHRTPLVATNHFMPDNLLAYVRLPSVAREAARTAAWRDFARWFNRADHVTTPTPAAAALVRRQGVRTPVEAISCGIDLSRFRACDNQPGRPTLLFVGRLEEEKHLDELVTALALLRRDVDARLVLAGTGSQQRRLTALAERLGVAAHVRFPGYVPDACLPDVYAAATVFCMPGTAELQSLATLEAMASGLPVVAADAMALPHLVRDDVNGHLYPPGDVAELVRQVRAILGDPRLRARMGAASRRIADEHDTAATLTAFETVYRRAREFDAHRMTKRLTFR